MDELIYYFVDDNEVLELINSVSSYTITDESITKSRDYWFNEMNDYSHNITFWDTGQITTMKNMFYNKKEFNELLLWNTTNVVDMSCMFYNATYFNQPLSWNTDNISSVFCMFCGASSFNQRLNWNIGNQVNIRWAFNDSGMYYLPKWYINRP